MLAMVMTMVMMITIIHMISIIIIITRVPLPAAGDGELLDAASRLLATGNGTRWKGLVIDMYDVIHICKFDKSICIYIYIYIYTHMSCVYMYDVYDACICVCIYIYIYI